MCACPLKEMIRACQAFTWRVGMAVARELAKRGPWICLSKRTYLLPDPLAARPAVGPSGAIAMGTFHRLVTDTRFL